MRLLLQMSETDLVQDAENTPPLNQCCFGRDLCLKAPSSSGMCSRRSRSFAQWILRFSWRRCVCKPHHFGSGFSDLHLRHLQDSETESLGLNAQCAQRGIRGGLKHPHLEGYEPRLHVACNGYGKRHSPHGNCQGKVRNCAAWSRGTA